MQIHTPFKAHFHNVLYIDIHPDMMNVTSRLAVQTYLELLLTGVTHVHREPGVSSQLMI